LQHSTAPSLDHVPLVARGAEVAQKSVQGLLLKPMGPKTPQTPPNPAKPIQNTPRTTSLRVLGAFGRVWRWFRWVFGWFGGFWDPVDFNKACFTQGQPALCFSTKLEACTGISVNTERYSHFDRKTTSSVCLPSLRMGNENCNCYLVFGRFPVKLGPETRSNGSGSKHGVERTQIWPRRPIIRPVRDHVLARTHN
jgi:hypothetical protein